MGYTTDFEGEISVQPKLPDEFVKRWNDGKEGDPNHQYTASSGPGGAVKAGTDFFMQYGWPPKIADVEQPDEWQQWELRQTPDDTRITWDGNEKFYEYIDWLKYLVAAILAEFPDSKFEGEITWTGEDRSDMGQIIMSPDGSRILISTGGITYGPTSEA